ncbi:CLUMA_CG019744, isoform A [Clunio marinus]|uniref:CLUMA_CG019744, isoform A n=1 Tax=Clunio marinus TaxID=568069 RepID=A0A1J1J2H0_9DIPT|nr:CLUMA_CG019744, isoform A [Clunio marinus]
MNEIQIITAIILNYAKQKRNHTVLGDTKNHETLFFSFVTSNEEQKNCIKPYLWLTVGNLLQHHAVIQMS